MPDWVYAEVEVIMDDPVFVVGYYAPDGVWQYDSSYENREEAIRRMAELNGVDSETVPGWPAKT